MWKVPSGRSDGVQGSHLNGSCLGQCPRGLLISRPRHWSQWPLPMADPTAFLQASVRLGEKVAGESGNSGGTPWFHKPGPSLALPLSPLKRPQQDQATTAALKGKMWQKVLHPIGGPPSIGGADKPVGSPFVTCGRSQAFLHSRLTPLGSEDSSVSRGHKYP